MEALNVTEIPESPSFRGRYTSPARTEVMNVSYIAWFQEIYSKKHNTAHRALRSNDSCFMLPSKSSVSPAGGVAICSWISGDNPGPYFAQGIHWSLSSFVSPLTKVPQRVGSVHLVHGGLHEPTLAGVISTQVSVSFFPRPLM